MDIQEQMRRAHDPDFIDPELGNVRNFLRMRGEDVDDDENFINQRDQEDNRPSNSEIEQALQPQQYEDIVTNAKECSICFMVFGEEE